MPARTKIAQLHPQSLRFSRSKWGLRICISDKCYEIILHESLVILHILQAEALASFILDYFSRTFVEWTALEDGDSKMQVYLLSCI